MSSLYITDNGHSRIIVRSLRHNAAFVRELRATLPYRSMEWSAAGQRWFINRECRGRVEAIGRRHFESVEIEEGVPWWRALLQRLTGKVN